MEKIQRNKDLVAVFARGNLVPTRELRRYDGTLDLTWHVDDCDERYVRLTTSSHGDDSVLVVRDLRAVDSVVLSDLPEIFEWVRSRLARLSAPSRLPEPGNVSAVEGS
jgi:hypothetical protein